MAVGALLALVGAAWWGLPALAGEDSRDVLPATLPDDARAAAASRPGQAFEPLALVVSYGAAGQLAVGAETGAVRRLVVRHLPWTLSLSADGGSVVWVDPDSPDSLRVWDVVDGEEDLVRVASGPDDRITSALVRPDGEQVAVTVSGARQQVVVVDLAGTETARVSMGRPLVWTADGEELLPFDEFDVDAFDVASGERRTVVESGDGEGVASALSPDEQTVVQWRTGAEGDGPLTGYVIDVSSGEDTALDSATTSDLSPDVLTWLADDMLVAFDPGDADDFADQTPEGTGLVTMDVSDQEAEPLVGWSSAAEQSSRQTLVVPEALAPALDSSTTSWWTDRPWLPAGLVLVGAAGLGAVVTPWSRRGR